MAGTRIMSVILAIAMLMGIFAITATAEETMSAVEEVASEAIESVIEEQILTLDDESDGEDIPEEDEQNNDEEADLLMEAAANEAPYSGYVLMNIPYTVFYGNVVKASRANEIDAITSATGKKAAYFRDSSYKGNAEVAYGTDATIKGVRFPVALSEADYRTLPFTEDTAADYYFTAMDAVPALYVNATVSESGAITFGALSSAPAPVEGATVTLLDSMAHGDYMLKIGNDGGLLTEADKATFEVYGVVIKTADAQYPLYHLENLYYKDFHEVAFCTASDTTPKGLNTHKDFFAGLEGATITELDYYTNAGAFAIAANVKVEKEAFSGYVLMNIPFNQFFGAIGAESSDIDAVTSATNKVGNYSMNGGFFHSGVTAGVDENGNVTAVGGENGAKIEGVIWPVKAAGMGAIRNLGGVEITDASRVTVATAAHGSVSSTDLTGFACLTEAPVYSFYKLAAEPANYLELSGKSFKVGAANAVAMDKLDVPVSYGTNWGDVQLNLKAAADAFGKLINGVVLTTDAGDQKALVPLAQMFTVKSEIAWRAETLSGLDGKKITNIRCYCTAKDAAYENFIYDYPVDIDVSAVYTGEVSAKFANANAIEVTGLPADARNVKAKVYHTTGGRGAVITYLTPLAVDPADDDIDPVNADVTDGKIAIAPGSVTNGKGETQTYGEPIDGTEYIVEQYSDNYIIHAARATYTAPAAPAVEVIEFSKKTTVTVDLTKDYQLAVTGKTIQGCKTSKAKVAEVSDTGLVDLKQAGSAKITVTTTDGKKLTLKLKVVDPAAPTGVSITNDKTLRLHVGDTVQLNAVITPDTADKAVTWRSNKYYIGSVDENGLFTALKRGTVRVSVRTVNGYKASVKIIISR